MQFCRAYTYVRVFASDVTNHVVRRSRLLQWARLSVYLRANLRKEMSKVQNSTKCSTHVAYGRGLATSHYVVHTSGFRGWHHVCLTKDDDRRDWSTSSTVDEFCWQHDQRHHHHLFAQINWTRRRTHDEHENKSRTRKAQKTGAYILPIKKQKKTNTLDIKTTTTTQP